ncbi:hypothetical protein [Burkholderia ubonensis]|uniref:hypothetical protein n=1 Tax=Burkholderia ubonensis TaxID=101571 RepID=UPI0012F8D482|nr:hypothetical protein [Burkholderia ubonensis]
MFKITLGRFGKSGVALASPSAIVELIDTTTVRVGDHLIAKKDVVFARPKSLRFVAWHAYAGRRRFTAGKAYQVVQIRARTNIAFVIDDQGFRTAVDQAIVRHFALAR